MVTLRRNPPSQIRARSRLRVPVLMAAGLIVASCGPSGPAGGREATEDQTPTVTDEAVLASAPVSEPETLVESAIVGTDDRSEVEGRVEVLWRSAGEPLQLVVEAEGLQAGDHAWDVHDGSCTSPGPVVLALSETDDRNGVVGPLPVAETRTVDVVFEVPMLAGMVPSDGRYTLHVHEKPGIVHGSRLGDPTTVACARL